MLNVIKIEEAINLKKKEIKRLIKQRMENIIVVITIIVSLVYIIKEKGEREREEDRLTMIINKKDFLFAQIERLNEEGYLLCCDELEYSREKLTSLVNKKNFISYSAEAHSLAHFLMWYDTINLYRIELTEMIEERTDLSEKLEEQGGNINDYKSNTVRKLRSVINEIRHLEIRTALVYMPFDVTKGRRWHNP